MVSFYDKCGLYIVIVIELVLVTLLNFVMTLE